MRNLLVDNSFSKVVDLSSVVLYSTRGMPRFRVDLSGQSSSSKNSPISLEPSHAALIGTVSFNTSADCLDITTDSPQSGDILTCYSGFDLSSAKGTYSVWLFKP